MTTIKELLDNVTEQETNEQRIIFVREAALRIYAANRDMNVSDAWRSAKWLWANKPEDC